MIARLQLALRNLTRHRRRSLTTGLALALGFAALLLLGGYVARSESLMRTNAVYLQHYGHLAIYKRGGLGRVASRPKQYGLTGDEQTRALSLLTALPEVAFAGRYLTGKGLVGNGCRSLPFLAIGVEPDIEQTLLSQPAVLRDAPELARPLRGSSLAEARAIPGATGLSRGLAHLLRKERVHDELPEAPDSFSIPDCSTPEGQRALTRDANVQLAALTYDGALGAIDGEVVHVFRTPLAATEDSSLVTNLHDLQQLLDTDRVTYLAVYLREGFEAAQLVRPVRDALAERGVEADVYAYDDARLNPYFAGTMGLLDAISRFFAVLVGCVVALSIANTITLALHERTRELGTLRAIGYRARQLSGLFVCEALLLCLLASLAGLLLGGGIAAAINAADIHYQAPAMSAPIPFLIQPTAAHAARLFVGMALLTVATTYVVVARRTRDPIVKLLTHNQP